MSARMAGGQSCAPMLSVDVAAELRRAAPPLRAATHRLLLLAHTKRPMGTHDVAIDRRPACELHDNHAKVLTALR